MDLGTIAGTLESLKSIGSVAKSLLEIRDAGLIKEKVLELQSAILSAQGSAITAQSEHLQMLQTVRELQTRIRVLEGWEQEKENYELATMKGSGVLVYLLKSDTAPSQVPHMLCVNCFNRGEKSTLQPDTKVPGMAKTLDCHNCGAVIYVHGQRVKEHGSMAIKARG
jgi:hypothetical protein